MRKGMSRSERKDDLLRVMQEIYQTAQSQADFTAETVARTAGVSTVLLYRYAGEDFKAMRNQLSGTHHPVDEVMRELRAENADLRRQLKDAQEKLRTTAVEELDKAILLIEELDEQNIQLRGEVKLLRKRLEEGGHVVVSIPSPGTTNPPLTVVGGKEYKGREHEQ